MFKSSSDDLRLISSKVVLKSLLAIQMHSNNPEFPICLSGCDPIYLHLPPPAIVLASVPRPKAPSLPGGASAGTKSHDLPNLAASEYVVRKPGLGRMLVNPLTIN